MVEEKESGKGGKVPAIALEKLRSGVKKKKKRQRQLLWEERCFKMMTSQTWKKRWQNRAEQWRMLSVYPSVPNLSQQTASTKLVSDEPW